MEPRWTRNASGSPTFTLNSLSAGILTIAVPTSGRVAFYQSDSLNTATNAYIESRFRTNTATLAGPEISFGIDDQVKFIAAGISSSQAGFLSSSFAFLPGAVSVTGTTFHTYQIRKFAADSVQLWIDGVRQVSRIYSTFSAHLTPESAPRGGTSPRAAPQELLFFVPVEEVSMREEQIRIIRVIG